MRARLKPDNRRNLLILLGGLEFLKDRWTSIPPKLVGQAKKQHSDVLEFDESLSIEEAPLVSEYDAPEVPILDEPKEETPAPIILEEDLQEEAPQEEAPKKRRSYKRKSEE